MWQALKNLRQIQSDPLTLMERVSKQGTLGSLQLPVKQAYLANTPEAVEDVLVTHAKAFGKTTRGYVVMRKLLGNGLLTSDGEFWLKQRRTAQPAFHRERIAALGDRMTRLTREVLDTWKTDETFDVHAQMMKLTLRIVADTLLSTDVASDSDAIGDAVTEVVEQALWRATHPLYWPDSFPTQRNKDFTAARTRLDTIVNGFIAERRGGVQKSDLLGMLMEARDPETGDGMTDAQLRDEIMTIFLAGHETTANVLSWAFALLGQHPDVEAKARQEVQGLGIPTAADLGRLPYLGAIVKEAMRLYPPAWIVGRGALQDVTIADMPIKKGNLVFVSAWTLHRDPRLWDRASEFVPERWLDPAFKPHKCAYIPFLTGPRKCIGDSFAIMEAVFVLAMTLQRFGLKGDVMPEPEPLVTLRPKGGLPMVAHTSNSSKTTTPTSTIKPVMMMKMSSGPNLPA